MTRRPRTIRKPSRHSRRGVAMLLVIIALGSATVLAGSYLASRRNTGAIGQNAALAVAAQWASRSGVELGIAMMQTNKDWRLASVDGVLINDVDLSGATVRVMITNLAGEAPGIDDVDLILTSMASVGGVTSTTQRVVIAPANLAIDDALNPALDEFGVFVTGNLQMEADAIIASWSLADRAVLNPTVKLGLTNGFASALDLRAGADLINVEAFAPSYASSSLQSMLNSTSFTDSTLLEVMPPALDSYAPGYEATKASLSGFGGGGINSHTFSGTSDSQPLAPGEYNNITIQNGAVVTVNGDYIMDNLTVRSSGVLVVEGDTSLAVNNLLEVINSSALELADANASVDIYLQHNAIFDDAGVGVSRAVARDIGRTADSITQYQDPRRVSIWGARLAPDRTAVYDSGLPRIDIDDNAIVLAAIHAPHHEVRIDDVSTLFGRITASMLWIDTGSAVFADPTLDNRAGYTTRIGPLYTSFGDPVPGLADAVATITQMETVEGVADTIAPQLDLSDTALTLTAGNAGDPTPRGAVLAQPTSWPIIAKALEDPLLISSDPTDGSIVELKISYDDYLATVQSDYDSTQTDLSGSTTIDQKLSGQVIMTK